MFYAKIDNGEGARFRFYNRQDRDAFVADHQGARGVTAKDAKFVAGADGCVTYSGKNKSGEWVRV